MYICEKNEEKRLSHTCALKNYIEKKNRTDSSLFVPMRSRKKKKEKGKKERSCFADQKNGQYSILPLCKK